ncbi:MAG: hypothetical protein NXI20_05980 [bacterium]|nr:hypothetical protein [bacterium]
MGILSQKQLQEIEAFLDRQGLKFPPLRAEIFDHMIGDIEYQLENGNTFEQAWNNISGELPQDHFKQIQNETMEAINKRFNVTRGLTYISVGLLILTSAFKLLHLPGAAMLLVASLFSIAVSFIVGTVSGIRINKGKKGSTLLLATVIAVLYFFVSWTFKLLYLPGASIMQISSVLFLLVLFPLAGLSFRSLKSSDDNLLTYLHSKHTPGIERFLLIFVVLETLLKVAAIYFGYHPNISGILLIMVICAGVMQYFAQNWHPSQQNNKIWFQILLFVALAAAMLPSLGSMIPYPVRVLLIASFYILAGVIVNIKDRDNSLLINSLVTGLVMLISGIWVMVKLNVAPESVLQLIFNLPILVIFGASLFATKSGSLSRTFMIISYSFYLFEYPYEMGLF